MAKEKNIVKKDETGLKKYQETFDVSLLGANKSLDQLKEKARFKITSQKKLEESKEIMASVKDIKDVAKDLREKFYKPIYDFSQLIYKPIKTLEDEVKKVEDFHKSEQLAWLKKLEKEEEERKAKIEEKLENGEISIEQAGNKIEKVESKAEAVKGITIRKVVKIVDFAKVPDKYKLPNMPLLNNDVLKDGVDVPGTQTVEEKSLSNR